MSASLPQSVRLRRLKAEADKHYQHVCESSVCLFACYRLGATGVLAEFAVKRYRGHRGVRAMELEAATEEWMKKAKMGAI
jgi:hypothetical protein